MRSIVAAMIFTSAGVAQPTAFGAQYVRDEIIAAQGVPSGAVRFASVHCLRRVAAQDVLLVWYGFQVGWINTRCVAAQVIQFSVVGYGTDKDFVGQAMSEHQPTHAFDMSVTFATATTLPQPATRMRVNQSPRKDSLWYAQVRSRHATNILPNDAPNNATQEATWV